MATYSKPQVSLLNGIVMGGGAGASIHGTFRVATENSVEYVGLTGSRLDGAEMLACGLATHFVPSKSLSLLEAALHKVASSELSTIQAILDEYSQYQSLKDKSAYHQMDVINKCFSKRTVEDILSALGS